ncbi:hypothetical protein BDB00DRAFT_618614 [Zychaea mexicana]|uniref:uncharacterized protein n=1 Tax=Zychaea mexicana TaxID=64656 RepID=UPI0022FEB8F9|nr:uncharacterized protein BDB00DRAFT_618614 [Zychaea mexicana]KAI9489359.1 hypothetical protein BDB00DRAFT_618614 [Zychaea mexicana]
MLAQSCLLAIWIHGMLMFQLLGIYHHSSVVRRVFQTVRETVRTTTAKKNCRCARSDFVVRGSFRLCKRRCARQLRNTKLPKKMSCARSIFVVRVVIPNRNINNCSIQSYFAYTWYSNNNVYCISDQQIFDI